MASRISRYRTNGTTSNGRSVGAADPPMSSIKSNAQVTGKNLLFRNWDDEADVFQGVKGAVPVYLNPDPIVREFGQVLSLGIYDDLTEKNPHVGGAFDSRFDALLGLDWDVVAWSDDAEHKAHAETVRRVLEAIPNFYDSRLGLLQSIKKGYAIAEIAWSAKRPGFIDALIDRDPRDFVFDLDWKPRVLTNKGAWDSKPVPDWRVLVMRYRASDWNPYGVGVGRGVYWFDHFKRAVLRYWVQYCERFATPIVDASYKAGSGLTDDDVLEQIDSLQTGSALAHTDDVIVQFLKGGGESGTFQNFLDYTDTQASKRISGQTLSADAAATGLGSGVANLQGEVRQDIVKSDARALECAMYGLVVPIVGFNHGWRDDGDYPMFKVRTAPPKDLATLLDEYERLTTLGLEIGMDHVRETFQVPEPEAGEDILVRASTIESAPAARSFRERPSFAARDALDKRDLDGLEQAAAKLVGARAARMQRRTLEALQGKAPGRR